MGDKYHLSNEQESYEYYLLHRSTESPTTTSSASSPMTTIMQNSSSAINWQAISTFDPVVSQYYDYSQHHYPPQHAWSLPQPQQHQQHNMLFQQHQQQEQQQHQLQQQLLHQQQHLSYRAPSVMQGSLYQQHPYHQQSHSDFIHFPPPPVVDVNYAQHYDIPHRPYNRSTNIPIDTNNSSSEQLIIDMNKNTENNNAVIPTPKIIERPVAAIKSVKVKYESPSPSSTPIPSPVISSSKRKRGRRASTSYQSSSMSQQQQQGGDGTLLEEQDVEERRSEKRTKQEEKEGGYGGTEGMIVKGNQKTVDQLENELDFLRDECATILIMLDSLRNAFLADIPAASSSTSRQLKSTLPLTGTINFMDESDSNNTPTFMINAKNSANETTPTPRRRSKIIAQNPEMEREMRIAYDDLMLQVRQLEKKVERLEGKSKSACTVAGSSTSEEKKKIMKSRPEENEDDDDQLSQHSSSNSAITVLSEEEKDNEDEDDGEYLKTRTKKMRRNSIASTNTNTTVKKKKIASRKD